MPNRDNDVRPGNGMPTVHIQIQEKDDAPATDLVGADLEKDRFIFLTPERAFLKKGSMMSGRSTITLYAKTEKGEHIFLETSGAMLKMIARLVLQIDGESL